MTGDLVVAVALADRLDALVLGIEQVVLAAEDVAGDVVLFQLGVHGEDDVGHQAVVLQPRMLGEHELDVGVPHGADVVVAPVPAGDPRRRVGPDHVDLGAAVGRILVVHELVGAVGGLGLAAPPVALTLEDALGHVGLGEERRVVGLIGMAAGIGAAQVGHAQRLRLRVLVGLVEEAPLDHLGLVDARLAEALHGEADALQTGRLGGVGAADAGAAVADDHRGALARPLLGQGLDGAGGDAADRRGPLRRLLHAVFLAHDVGLELVDAHRVRGEVLLVVRAVLEPLVADAQVHGGVGIRQHRDPSVGVHGRSVVEIRTHVDLLDAQLAPPVAQPAGQLTLPAPRRGLLVAAPEEEQFGVLGDVPEQVALLALADGLAAPEVLAAPPPAFPAVGLAHLQRETAPLAEQLAAGAVAGLHDLVLAVLVALVEQGGGAVLLLDAVHLAGDDVERLLPGDALELAHAAVLRVALAVGVEVDAHHRVADAGRGVHALLVGEAVRGDEGLHAGLEGAPPHFHLPGVQVFLLVLPVVVHRADADDLAVLDVHHRGVGAVLRHAAEADVADQRLLAAGSRLAHVLRHTPDLRC